MKILTFALASFLSLTLLSCGKRVNAVYPELVAIENIPTPPLTEHKKSHADILPCDYWNQLTQIDSTDDQDLQLISDLKMELNWRNSLIVQGRFVPKYLPQVRFLLSGEAVAYDLPGEPVLEGNVPTRFDASLEELLSKVEDLYQKHKIGTATYYGIKAAENTIVNTEKNDWVQRKLRTQAATIGTNGVLPGSLDGKVADIIYSQIFDNLRNATGISEIEIGDKDSLYLISKKVPIFTSKNWSERRIDLANSFLALENKSDDRDQKICKFAIGQRVLSQLITLKGIKAAPSLNPDGLFFEIPEGNYPQEDIVGEFGDTVAGDVATIPWVLSHATRSDPKVKIKNAASLSETLDAFSYWVELTSHRDEALWKKYLEPRLLGLGLGAYAIVGSMVQNSMIVNSDNRIQLKPSNEDSPENLSKLLLLTLEIVESFEPMEKFKTPFEKEMLKPLAAKDVSRLTHDLRINMSGVLLEALARIKAGQGSDQLKAAYEEVADRVGNPWLLTLIKNDSKK